MLHTRGETCHLNQLFWKLSGEPKVENSVDCNKSGRISAVFIVCPAAASSIQTIKGGYAFHYGGRKELQFNIGYEGDVEVFS